MGCLGNQRYQFAPANIGKTFGHECINYAALLLHNIDRSDRGAAVNLRQ